MQQLEQAHSLGSPEQPGLSIGGAPRGEGQVGTGPGPREGKHSCLLCLDAHLRVQSYSPISCSRTLGCNDQVVFIEHLLYARNFVLISFDPHTRLWIRNHRCHLEMMKMRLRELE